MTTRITGAWELASSLSVGEMVVTRFSVSACAATLMGSSLHTGWIGKGKPPPIVSKRNFQRW